MFLREYSVPKPLDRLDRKLLALFHRDTRVTTADLGEKIGLSATACQRRLNRMRRDGIIEREIALVSPKSVDRPVTLIVEVVLERGTSGLIESFKKLARSRPEISQCYYVTGRADFILVVSMPDMERYAAFMREVFFDNPDVKSFETSTVVNRTKVGFDLPIE